MHTYIHTHTYISIYIEREREICIIYHMGMRRYEYRFCTCFCVVYSEYTYIVCIKHTPAINNQHVPAIGNRTAVLDQLVKGQDGFACGLRSLQSDPDEVPIIHDPSASVQGLLMAGQCIIPGLKHLTSRYWKRNHVFRMILWLKI